MKRRQIASAAIAALFFSFASGLPIWAKTTTVTGTSQTLVESAISSATEGDIIIVPSGTDTWNNLTVNKAITLQGSGTKQTTISGSTRIITLSPPSGKTCRVSNFTFNGNGAQYWSGVVGMSGVARLDNTTITGAAGWAITANDCLGLIDHVTFRSYNGGIMVENQAWGGHSYGDGSWAEPHYMGTEKALYVEACDFQNNGQVGAIDAVGGAHYVFRYNKVVGDILVCHGTDSTGRPRGTRAVEIYRNDMTGGSGFAEMFEMRSGTGVIFGNVAKTYSAIANLKEFRSPESGVNFSWAPWGAANGSGAYDGNTDSSGYPDIDQCGRGKGDLLAGATPAPVAWPHQAAEPVYAWSNTLNGGTGNIGSSYTAIRSGRDYFNGTQLTGYTPYTCPHPMTGLTGTCNSTAGLAGYNVAGSTSSPNAPNNLHVSNS